MRNSLKLFYSIITILIIGVNAKANDTLTVQKDTLKVAYYLSPPFVESEKGKIGGISFWLWEHIAKELKQPFILQEMPLNEVIKGLAEGTVDMTINPLTITSERSLMIDFSAPYFISNSGLLVKSVSTFQKWASLILSFFSINFLRAILALFMVIFIFGALVWFFERKTNPSEFKPGFKGLWSGIWWSAVTMTTVGYGDKAPKSFGGRVIGLIWMFAAVIIISGFTASIASSLTVNQLDWSKSKIDDYKDVKMATVEGSATMQFLKQHFFKNVIAYKSLDDCVKAFDNKKVLCIAYDYPQITSIALKDTSDKFGIAPLKYHPQLYAFGFSESLGNDIKKNITNELLKLVESNDYKIILAEYSLLEE